MPLHVARSKEDCASYSGYLRAISMQNICSGNWHQKKKIVRKLLESNVASELLYFLYGSCKGPVSPGCAECSCPKAGGHRQWQGRLCMCSSYYHNIKTCAASSAVVALSQHLTKGCSKLARLRVFGESKAALMSEIPLQPAIRMLVVPLVEACNPRASASGKQLTSRLIREQRAAETLA